MRLLLFLWFFALKLAKNSPPFFFVSLGETYVIEIAPSALAYLETEVAHGVSDNAFRNKSFVTMYFYPAIASIFLFFLRKNTVSYNIFSFFSFSFSIFSQCLLFHVRRRRKRRATISIAIIRFRYNFLNKHPFPNLASRNLLERFIPRRGKCHNYSTSWPRSQYNLLIGRSI